MSCRFSILNSSHGLLILKPLLNTTSFTSIEEVILLNASAFSILPVPFSPEK